MLPLQQCCVRGTQLYTFTDPFKLHDKVINIRNNIKMSKNIDAFVLFC